MADLLDPNDLHPQALAHRPPTAADAVEAQARIDAVKRWLDAVRDRLRDFIEDQATESEQALGGTFNLPVTGVGRALMTDPTPNPRVTDSRLFAGWLADYGHADMTAEAVEVKISDPDRVIAECEAVDDSDDVDYHVCVPREAFRVDRYRVPTEDALDRLLDDPDSRVRILDAAPGEPWVAYIDDDGEPHEVPGTAVSMASRRLQVRIEKGHKAELDAAVERAVGPPQLDGANDER